MANLGNRAAERYKLLAEGLGEQLGKRYGWLSEVARTLGIDVSQLKRVLAGRGGVGLATIELAVERVPIRRAYFTHDGVTDWRDYIATEAEGDPALESNWGASRVRAQEFVASLRSGAPNAQIARDMAWLIIDDPIVRAALELRAAVADDEAVERGHKLAALLLADEAPTAPPHMDTVQVRAVPGRLISMGGETMPIGYRKAKRGDDPATVYSFRSQKVVAEGVHRVPLTAHIKSVLDDGGLERC